ncbi:MAG: glycosyltransferase family 2 protein [Deltaproteobacteria bacterium]|nr:glycosyltransferase family 2 protein [Deltaproteobacteria bacterium]
MPIQLDTAVNLPASSSWQPSIVRSADLTGKFAALWLSQRILRIVRFFDRVFYSSPYGPKNDPLARNLKPIDPIPLSQLETVADESSAVLLNGSVNHCDDIQGMLTHLKTRLNRHSRVVLVLYNPYWKNLASALGFPFWKRSFPPTPVITRIALECLSDLSGYDVALHEPVLQFPYRWFGLGLVINIVLSLTPGVRWIFARASLAILRPRLPERESPTVSLLLPVRNELGNLTPLMDALSKIASHKLEVIFIEGGSKDGSWEGIQNILTRYRGPMKLQALQQTGRGKADAVRLGAQRASGTLIVIFDTDLTVPVDRLPLFWEAYQRGHGDFLNGSRLVYPCEKGAMQFLNRLGNIFFARALSRVLGNPISDSLCGTKAFPRAFRSAMVRWRKEFGDNFDPFGDFELLFSAARMGVGITNIPIRYLSRTYGTTNISRFLHGWMLLKMTVSGYVKTRMFQW